MAYTNELVARKRIAFNGAVTSLLLLCLLLVSIFFYLVAKDYNPAQKYQVLLYTKIAIVFIILISPTFKYGGLLAPVKVFAVLYLFVYGFGGWIWVDRGLDLSEKTVFYSTLAIISFAFGFVTTRPFYSPEHNPSVIYAKPYFRKSLIFFIIVPLICFLLFLAVAGIPALRPDALTYRFEARQRISSYVIFTMRSIQLPLYFAICASLLGLYFTSRKVRIFLVLAIFAVYFINFVPGWRNPLFFITLNLALIFGYSTSAKKATAAALFVFIGALTILTFGFMRLYNLSSVQEVGAITYFRSRSSSDIEMFLLWASNALSVYSYGFIQSLYAFPDVLGHLHGRVILITLSTMLPGQGQLLDQILKEALGMDFDGGGLNLSLLGESYADFGMIGVILYPFIYGGIMGVLMKAVERNKTPARIVPAAFVMSCIIQGTMTGLLSISIYHILGAFLVFILYMERKSRGRKGALNARPTR